MIAFVPARAASSRVPGKNIRPLAGRPLLLYSIASALESGVFSAVYVVSESSEILHVGAHYGATPIWRPPVLGSATAPDIGWVRYALERINAHADHFGPDSFAILRPTSPFRSVGLIRRALAAFVEMGECADSLRTVTIATQTPYKAWSIEKPGQAMRPLLDGENADGVPWHSCPTQTCPVVYQQTSVLEMAWTRCVSVFGTISGRKIAPFITEGRDAFAIDTMADWREAERLAAEHPEWLPVISETKVSWPETEH